MPLDYDLTDMGHAARLVDSVKGDLYYLPNKKCWVLWNGRYWERDSGESEILTRLRAMIASLKTEAVSEGSMGLASAAKRLSSYKGFCSVTALAKNMPSIIATSKDFDLDPMLLNCTNGTLNLATNALKSHCKEDMITRMITTSYEPSATCPRWRQFIDEIMCGNRELTHFLQKAIGYSLTGDNREQVMFILYGLGANGKTTFIEALRDILGEYTRAADPATFTMAKAHSVRSDIARMAGTRLVTAVEMNSRDSNSSLDAALVKQMTGRDRITARELYGKDEEIVPSWKVWLLTNHLPNIPGSDAGIWRRIRVIKFAASFEGAKDNQSLQEELTHEREGILTWAIEGCKMWLREGLTPPESVLHEVKAFREETDPVTSFIHDLCTIDPDIYCPSADLYKEYMRWASLMGEDILSQRRFSANMRSRKGIRDDRDATTRYLVGIGLSAKKQSMWHPVKLTTVTNDEE
jgi:putative DNA primase/helicase